MAVSVNSAAAFEEGEPIPLFEFRASGNLITPYYSVTRDGQRFLLATTQESESVAPLTVVLNWMTEIKKPTIMTLTLLLLLCFPIGNKSFSTKLAYKFSILQVSAYGN